MKKILIADTTVLKTYGTFGFKEAVEAARKLSDLNVDIIELPKIENKAKDTLFIKTISSFIKNSIISVNAGNTPEEISTAANALNGIKNARLRIELPLSDVNMEYSLHKKGKVMESFAVSLFEEAQKTNIDTEFCALDATRADKELLKSVLSAAITHGVKTVSVYDNEGILFPDSFADFVNDTFKDIDVTDVNVGVCVNNINGFALSCSFLAAKGKANVIKVSAIDNGIGSRRTGCRDTGHLREDAELVGNHIRRSPTIVGFDILVVIVVCQKVKIVALALVHTPHSSPRYEGYIIPPPFGGG